MLETGSELKRTGLLGGELVDVAGAGEDVEFAAGIFAEAGGGEIGVAEYGRFPFTTLLQK